MGNGCELQLRSQRPVLRSSSVESTACWTQTLVCRLSLMESTTWRSPSLESTSTRSEAQFYFCLSALFSPLFIILRSDSQRQCSFRSVLTGIQIFLKYDIIQGPSNQSNIAPNPAGLSILPGRLLLPSEIPGVNYRVSTG